MRLHGIFPPLTTPFANDGTVSVVKLRENVARYNKTRLAGYAINGSTSESVLLTWDEVYRIWETAREAAAPDKILIAGTGADDGDDRAHESRSVTRLHTSDGANAEFL
jgi:4-hydroxy-2-oxoglutarate aldolase